MWVIWGVNLSIQAAVANNNKITIVKFWTYAHSAMGHNFKEEKTKRIPGSTVITLAAPRGMMSAQEINPWH